MKPAIFYDIRKQIHKKQSYQKKGREKGLGEGRATRREEEKGQEIVSWRGTSKIESR